MIEELKRLKELRTKIVEQTQFRDELNSKVQATPEYQAYLDAHAKLSMDRAEADELEKAIKEEAVDLSRYTGFVERDFGSVKIKEFTVVKVLDQKQAVVWAAANAPSCLTLTKDFDKAAKALELPFIQVEKEYRAQIATDLSKLE